MVRGSGSWSGKERNCAFLNIADGHFADVSAVTGLDFPDDGRAAAIVDWDQDGLLDLCMANRTSPRIRLMRNAGGNPPPYVAVLLQGKLNRDAIGARVELHIAQAPTASQKTETLKLIKTLNAGHGYLTQSSKWLHFGLGDASAIVRLDVRWPGGEVESFRGLKANHRYKIVQGSGKAAEWSRPGPSPRLTPTQQDPPPLSERTRTVLAARIPLPDLQYSAWDGTTKPLSSISSNPFLINLWASWCQPCLFELTQWAEQRDALQQSGLRMIALNVDEPSNQSDAKDFLLKINWPFESGTASPELLDALDLLQRGVLDRRRPLPLPSTFLVDPQRQLAVIYKGPIETHQILSDVSLLSLTPAAIRESAAAFPGRWYLPPPKPDLATFADRFARLGRQEPARFYLNLCSQQLTESTTETPLRRRIASVEYNLGNAFTKAGDDVNAMEAYRRALATDPNHVRAHVNLALALMRMNDAQSAIRHLTEALRLDPNHALARKNLAQAQVLLVQQQ